MRRCPGLVLIASLLWLGWNNWGTGVSGSALGGRYPDIPSQNEAELTELIRWNRVPYRVPQRTRRGQGQPSEDGVKQCRNRLPESIQKACEFQRQTGQTSQLPQSNSQNIPASEDSPGGMYGRVMMRKRSSARPLTFTNAYDECCKHGPCKIHQLQKYCHHFRYRNPEPMTTTVAVPTESTGTKQLGSVSHRLTGSKPGRLSARSTRMPTSFQNFKPVSSRLNVRTGNTRMASSDLLHQSSKCLEDLDCNKGLGEILVSTFKRQEDQLESLEGLCLRGKRGDRSGKERAPDILRIILGLLSAFVTPPSSNNTNRNSTDDCYHSTDDTKLAEEFLGFQLRFKSRRPCQQVPTESQIQIGASNNVDGATFD